MSLRDRYTGSGDSETKSDFTCPHYAPKPGTKRCRHYVGNGACDRPDELMCVEWTKVNASASTPPPKETNQDDVDRDLFGNPLPPRPKQVEKPPPTTTSPVTKSPPPVEAPLIRNLTDEEIASFKELGAEVCLASDDVGELWLVPKYTYKERQELSIDHAATLTAICAAFPGAKVTAFEKAPPKTTNEKPEKG